jgi:hypothetical protein
VIVEEIPAGVGIWKSYRDYAVLYCNHDGEHHARLPSGALMCGFCKADEDRTDGFSQRVLVFAKLGVGVKVEAQAALF